MIVLLQLEFPGLLNLLQADGFFAIMVARQDLGGSLLPVQAVSRWFLPRLKCLRLLLWCRAEEMSVSVRQSGADSGGKVRGNHLPPAAGGTGLQASGLHHQVSPSCYPLSFNISKVCNNLYFLLFNWLREYLVSIFLLCSLFFLAP